MGKFHDWNQPKSDVTLEKVLQVANVLVEKIQANGGTWTGTIQDVMNAVGEKDGEEYGTYKNAVDTATKLYNIRWDKAGRNGRKYFIDDADLARFYAERAKLSKVFEFSVDVTIACPYCHKPTNYTVSIQERRD